MIGRFKLKTKISGGLSRKFSTKNGKKTQKITKNVKNNRINNKKTENINISKNIGSKKVEIKKNNGINNAKVNASKTINNANKVINNNNNVNKTNNVDKTINNNVNKTNNTNTKKNNDPYENFSVKEYVYGEYRQSKFEKIKNPNDTALRPESENYFAVDQGVLNYPQDDEVLKWNGKSKLMKDMTIDDVVEVNNWGENEDLMNKEHSKTPTRWNQHHRLGVDENNKMALLAKATFDSKVALAEIPRLEGKRQEILDVMDKIANEMKKDQEILRENVGEVWDSLNIKGWRLPKDALKNEGVNQEKVQEDVKLFNKILNQKEKLHVLGSRVTNCTQQIWQHQNKLSHSLVVLVRNETPKVNTGKIDFTDFSGLYKDIPTHKLMSPLPEVFRGLNQQSTAAFLHLLPEYYAMNGKTATNDKIMAMLPAAEFIGGFTKGDVIPVMKNLHNKGIGSILDYAAEASTQQVDLPDVASKDVYTAYNRWLEEKYEAKERKTDVEIFLDSIDAATSSKFGFAAVKVSALADVPLLRKVSASLRKIRSLFLKFEAEKGGKLSFEEFEQGIKQLGVSITQEKSKKLFDKMDKNKDGKIDFLEWVEYLNPADADTHPFLTLGNNSVVPALNSGDLVKYSQVQKKLEQLAQVASEKNVRLLVDAEQSFYQPAIDHLVLGLQRKYNKTFPTVYGTYQCYMKGMDRLVEQEVKRAKREGFQFGGKIVRGAYMAEERRAAKAGKYVDPVHKTKEDTDATYKKVTEHVLDNIEHTNLMFATHSTASLQHITNIMHDKKIENGSKRVAFGSLYGMRDEPAELLAHHGFNPVKYIPYGEPVQVLPYLLRRLEENLDLLNGEREAVSGKDLEKFRRLKRVFEIYPNLKDGIYKGRKKKHLDEMVHKEKKAKSDLRI